MSEARPIAGGWWTRVGSRVVDLVVLGWISAFVLFEIQGRLLGAGTSPSLLRVVLVTALLGFAYEVGSLRLLGTTLGKAVLGLNVVDSSSLERPGLAACFLRWLVLYGSFAIPIVGPVVVVAIGLSGLVLPNRRGVHDLVAGTVVTARIR